MVTRTRTLGLFQSGALGYRLVVARNRSTRQSSKALGLNYLDSDPTRLTKRVKDRLLSTLIGFATLSFKLWRQHTPGYEWKKKNVRESLFFYFSENGDERPFNVSSVNTALVSSVYVMEFWEELMDILITQKMTLQPK